MRIVEVEGDFPVAVNDLRLGFPDAIGGRPEKIPDAVFRLGKRFTWMRASVRDSGFLPPSPFGYGRVRGLDP